MFAGNLPPPTTSEEIGARLLAQERFHDKNVSFVPMHLFTI